MHDSTIIIKYAYFCKSFSLAKCFLYNISSDLPDSERNETFGFGE